MMVSTPETGRNARYQLEGDLVALPDDGGDDAADSHATPVQTAHELAYETARGGKLILEHERLHVVDHLHIRLDGPDRVHLLEKPRVRWSQRILIRQLGEHDLDEVFELIEANPLVVVLSTEPKRSGALI